LLGWTRALSATPYPTSIRPAATRGIATSGHLGFRLAGILTVDAVKRHITLGGRQGRVRLPPQAVPAEGRPEGADAPINQSRQAHHSVVHAVARGGVVAAQVRSVVRLMRLCSAVWCLAK
jgi:hypothetical protein